jgi:hypothetical protein
MNKKNTSVLNININLWDSNLQLIRLKQELIDRRNIPKNAKYIRQKYPLLSLVEAKEDAIANCIKIYNELKNGKKTIKGIRAIDLPLN